MQMMAPLEVGICVENMQKMVDFYIDILGFEYIGLAEAVAEKSLASGFSTAGYEIIRLQTNYGERIKFNRPLIDPLKRSDGDCILEYRGTSYLTFIVQDLVATVEKLQAAGMKILPESGSIEVRPGVHICTTRDPEGNYLEFVEYADLGSYRGDLLS